MYEADQTDLIVAGMRWVVRNPRGTIVCFTRECDGLTAEENAQKIAGLLNQKDGLDQ